MKTNTTKKTKDFKFKQFDIYGGLCGMAISTDGVLLGAWSQCGKSGRILDIGTGTGLLALMCAQRFPDSQITAIDIDDDALSAARINFANSNWSHRIQLVSQNILSYTDEQMFDSIICNPPYFNSGEVSQNNRRAKARHTDTLNHQALLNHCQTLLSPTGNACFILPVSEGEQFVDFAVKNLWYLSRVCRVKPTPEKATNRLLIELTLQAEEYKETELIIRENNIYSDAFVALTKEFYLKM